MTLTILIVGFNPSLQTSTLAPDVVEIAMIFLPCFPITVPAEEAVIFNKHSLAFAVYLVAWVARETFFPFPEIIYKEKRQNSGSNI